MATLACVREILGDACVELAKLDEIRHPDARWLLGDLTEAIGEQLISAQAEQDRIRNSSIVLEDAS